jgi:hypothetical protein
MLMTLNLRMTAGSLTRDLQIWQTFLQIQMENKTYQTIMNGKRSTISSEIILILFSMMIPCTLVSVHIYAVAMDNDCTDEDWVPPEVAKQLRKRKRNQKGVS